MNFLKKCLDWRVITGPVLVVGATAALAPNWLSVVTLRDPGALPAVDDRDDGDEGSGKNNGQAVAALKERYAKGEITQQQFEQMKREVSTRR